eukprot:TRINITY_DN5892_c0_g1_i1.p1 TRINITY_DN5892_c0_g1~~TRINITY_DN5892_c0_g1_i1.p1  ORF type:complete len:276 (+),score=44.33 TRINITY_DN5892_c0_g1_i1:150-977(+)
MMKSTLCIGVPMSAAGELPPNHGYRVNCHVPKHEAIKRGRRHYASLGQTSAMSDAGTSAWSETTRASRLSRAESDVASAYAAKPLPLDEALEVVYRQQGRHLFTKTTEPPATPLLNDGQPREPLQPLKMSRTMRPVSSTTALDRLDRRCDELLDCLVGGDAGEQRSRLCSENRELSRHSALVRGETRRLVDNMRSTGADPNPRQLNLPDPPTWPNPIANKVPPIYQSGYDRFYGVREDHHLEGARRRAKSVIGNEREQTMTAWGPGFHNSVLMKR